MNISFPDLRKCSKRDAGHQHGGVSVAKSLHQFVEATSLCKAPCPNQRDLGETAMGHVPTSSPKLCNYHSWKSKSQGTISEHQRIRREIWGCLSWEVHESSESFAENLRVQNCVKLYEDGVNTYSYRIWELF